MAKELFSKRQKEPNSLKNQKKSPPCTISIRNRKRKNKGIKKIKFWLKEFGKPNPK